MLVASLVDYRQARSFCESLGVGALYDSCTILGSSLVYPLLVLGNETKDKPKSYLGSA